MVSLSRPFAVLGRRGAVRLALALAWLPLLAACGSDREGPPPPDADAQVIAAAVDASFDRDNTLRDGGFEFDRLEVVTTIGGFTERRLDARTRQLIVERLAPTPVAFVDSREQTSVERAAKAGLSAPTEGVADIEILELELDGEEGRLRLGFGCGVLCGFGIEYRPRRGGDGGWKLGKGEILGIA